MDRVLSDQARHHSSDPTADHCHERPGDLLGDALTADGLWNDDPVERYFACITTCSLDDGECITVCTEQLRESH